MNKLYVLYDAMPEDAVADRLKSVGSPACAGAAPPRAFGVTL